MQQREIPFEKLFSKKTVSLIENQRKPKSGKLIKFFLAISGFSQADFEQRSSFSRFIIL